MEFLLPDGTGASQNDNDKMIQCAQSRESLWDMGVIFLHGLAPQSRDINPMENVLDELEESLCNSLTLPSSTPDLGDEYMQQCKSWDIIVEIIGALTL